VSGSERTRELEVVRVAYCSVIKVCYLFIAIGPVSPIVLIVE
jgi:hypothetical protein